MQVVAQLRKDGEHTTTSLVVLNHRSPPELAPHKGWPAGTTYTFWVMEAQVRTLTGAKHVNEDMMHHLAPSEYLSSKDVQDNADLKKWRGQGIDALKRSGHLPREGNAALTILMPLETLLLLLTRRPPKGQVNDVARFYSTLAGCGKRGPATAEAVQAALVGLQDAASCNARVFRAVATSVAAAVPETGTLSPLLGGQGAVVEEASALVCVVVVCGWGGRGMVLQCAFGCDIRRACERQVCAPPPPLAWHAVNASHVAPPSCRCCCVWTGGRGWQASA